MTNLAIPDELAEQLAAIAQREHRSIQAVLVSMMEVYVASDAAEQRRNEAFLTSLGMFEDDVTDLSTTVQETMDGYWKKKYGDSD